MEPLPDDRFGSLCISLTVDVSRLEYRLVKNAADQEGVTIANYIRRAINAVFLDAGKDEFLKEQKIGRPSSYDEAFKRRIATLRQSGMSWRRIAARVGCSVSYACKAGRIDVG